MTDIDWEARRLASFVVCPVCAADRARQCWDAKDNAYWGAPHPARVALAREVAPPWFQRSRDTA